MDPYHPQQPDEGYSEDPLSGPGVLTASAKTTPNDADAVLLPPVLARQISGLSMASKIRLAEALLESLPTSAIAQIVQKLHPRLYIDFVRYLPAEICLKILSYLDPLSLLSVASACRSWYGLAVDRKLWEQLYYLEGWKTIASELQAWEDKVNRDRPMSSGAGHVSKRRAISSSRRLESDRDHFMPDADRSWKSTAASPTAPSLFGAPSSTSIFGARTKADADTTSAASASARRKGKQRAHSPPPTTIRQATQSPSAPCNKLPKSTLWAWDAPSDRYRMNWRHLYALRWRLESNWELGRYTNFQFPHPNHPEEAHREYIYTIQFNPEYLVSGSRDRTIRIWNMNTRRLARAPLVGHRGSVLCLQFDADPAEDLIVSGSSDTNIILWRFSTGQILQRLTRAHYEPVLNVKFDKNILVTCSKDRTIKIFNRRSLRPGDLGYGKLAVEAVPTHLVNYAYDILDQLPLKPPYTMIGSLEGHSAAVNAVQIHGREIVSASGDRNVKIWDWPTQSCVRTLIGHSKGIACVQYDGRRIVSGSSDNEVKVFDRRSGLEVACLRSHSGLVRAVQGGFGDLPYSVEEDEKEAAKVDERYMEAVQNGTISPNPRARIRRTSSRSAAPVSHLDGETQPDDILFTGAKLPPGGGGGQYARIVSGSYDTTIIIWRRDKRGVWKAQHRLRQEEAAAAATASAAPVAPATARAIQQQQYHQAAAHAEASQEPAIPFALQQILQTQPPNNTALPAPAAPQPAAQVAQQPSVVHADVSDTAIANSQQAQHSNLSAIVDNIIAQGVHALQQALATYPGLLEMHHAVHAAIDRHPSPFVRSQLRQALATAQIRTQIAIAQGGQLGTAVATAAMPTDATVVGVGVPSSSASLPAAVSTPGLAQISAPTATTGPAGQTPAMLAPQVVPLAGIESHNAMLATAGSTTDAAAAATLAVPMPTAPSAPAAPAAPVPMPAAVVGHHPHIPPGAEIASPSRVFKLQFDARRIICCSQTPVIVGWDFCNGDLELEEAARFFAPIE